MEVSINELRQLCTKALIGSGLSSTEAEMIFEDYLDAEVRGKPSHGFAAFGVVANDAKSRGKASTTMIAPNVAHVRGNGDIGHLVMRDVVVWASKATQESGVAIAGVSNIKRFATPGSICSHAAKLGLGSVIFEYGGQAFLAPPGTAEAVLSTNPIGIGIPMPEGPYILDMAVSERAFYFITLAKSLGEAIPESWAIDSDGAPTSDPSKATAVQAFGGYKGYGLAFMLEILTGILMGVNVGLDGHLQERGAFAIFFRPNAFGVGADTFTQKVERLVSQIKSARLAAGGSAPLIPGEGALARSQQAMTSGVVRLPDAVVDTIRKLAAGG